MFKKMFKEDVEFSKARNWFPFVCELTGKRIYPFQRVYTSMVWRRDVARGRLVLEHRKMSEEEYMMRKLKDELTEV